MQELLTTYLLPKSLSGHSKVLYRKMQGDFNRYLAEVSNEPQKEMAAGEANKAYEEGLAAAQQVLRYSNPLRLNIILNFAIFLHEFPRNITKAIEYLDQALNGLRKEGNESIPKEDKEEVALLKQIIETNINVWFQMILSIFNFL